MHKLLIACLGLFAATLTVASETQPSEAADYYASLPVSSSLSTPTQVAGVLKDASNLAIANQQVVLLAEPTEANSNVQDAPLAGLSRTVTDSSGNFLLTAPSANGLLPNAEPGGLISFIVLAPGTSARPFYFSRRLALMADGYVLEAPGLPATNVNNGNGLVAAVAGDGSSSEFSAPEGTTLGGSGSSGADPDSFAAATYTGSTGTADNSTIPQAGTGTCTKTPVTTYPGRYAIVGQFFSSLGSGSQWTKTKSGSAAWSEYHYTSGSTSKIGVAVSDTGKYGSFSMSGTKHKDSSATQGFGTQFNDGGWYHQSTFTSTKYRYTCPLTSWYATEPTAWDGGDSPNPVTQASIPFGVNSCVNENPGDDWDQTRSTAVTWTNGYSLNAVIGIDVSITTGYSSLAHLYVKFNRTGRLCGRGSTPGNNPYVLAALKPA